MTSVTILSRFNMRKLPQFRVTDKSPIQRLDPRSDGEETYSSKGTDKGIHHLGDKSHVLNTKCWMNSEKKLCSAAG